MKVDIEAARTSKEQARNRSSNRNVVGILLFLIILNIGSFVSSPLASCSVRWTDNSAIVNAFQQCSMYNFLHTGLPFLKGVKAPDIREFEERRDRLAQALSQDGFDAFIMKPGYTYQYYANASQEDWEPWEPEERSFLMIVRPVKDDSGRVSANTTFLAPAFEAERLRLLGMPFTKPLIIDEWEEHWDYTSTL